MLRSTVLAVLALGLTPTACKSSAERQEARRVVAAIDRMRQSPPEHREPLIVALEKQTVDTEIARQARDRCAEAYRALHDGAALESELRRRLALPTPPATAAADLARAEARIDHATRVMPRCNEALAALRRAGR